MTTGKIAGTSKRSRGIVLPSVLWITILTIVVAVNYASAVQLNTRTTDNVKTLTLAKYDAMSGIYFALDRLLSSPVGDDALYRIELNGNTVEIAVSAEKTKTNLNAASADEMYETFVAAGFDAEMAATLAARVVDWRDADKSPQNLGMEDAQYFAQGKPYGAKDALIQDLVELLLMADIDPLRFKSLPDHVTIYSSAIRNLYTLTSRVHNAQGAQIYSSRAVVQLTRQRDGPYRILKWQNHDG